MTAMLLLIVARLSDAVWLEGFEVFFCRSVAMLRVVATWMGVAAQQVRSEISSGAKQLVFRKRTMCLPVNTRGPFHTSELSHVSVQHQLITPALWQMFSAFACCC